MIPDTCCMEITAFAFEIIFLGKQCFNGSFNCSTDCHLDCYIRGVQSCDLVNYPLQSKLFYF